MKPPEVVPKIDGEDIRISATAFMSFKRCPQSANERFQGNFGPSSKISFTGSLAHQIFKRHLTKGSISSESFVQVCKEEIGSTPRLNNTLAELRLKSSEVLSTIEEVRSLYERFVKYPNEGFTGAEVSFEILAALGVLLIGQIDAVFKEGSGHRLVDWKTGGLGESDSQLLFYALLWVLEHDELPAQLEAISVKTGERVASQPTLAQVGEVATEVGEMVDLLRMAWKEGGDLERRGGPWCQYCPVLVDCPEGSATMSVLSGRDGGPPG